MACCSFLTPLCLIKAKSSLFLLSYSSIEVKFEYYFLLLTLCSFYSACALRSNLPTDLVEVWAAARFWSSYFLFSLSFSTLTFRLESIRYFLEGLCCGFSASSFFSTGSCLIGLVFFCPNLSLVINSFIVDISIDYKLFINKEGNQSIYITSEKWTLVET